MSSFPDGWQPTLLRDSGKWLSGGTPSTTTPEYWNGDIPWISSGSLTNFRLWDSDRRITDLGAEHGTRIVKAGTILMVVRGMSLKTEFRLGIAQRDMAFGQDCKALVAGPGIDPEFLAYSIAARSQHILGIVDEAGHGTGRLNSDQLYAVEIGVPIMAEQQAIAQLLSALDDKIAANTKLAVTAVSLGRALYRSAINRPDAVSVQLRNVANNVAGRYLAKEDYVSDGPYFVYGSNSVMGRHDRALQQGGFAVLAKIGSYCGNLRWSQRPAWVNNNASAIVPMTGTEPSVLRHGLDLIDMTPHRAGTGQPYIRMESLFSAEMKVPASDVSSKVAPILESLSELEVRQGEENLTLASTRNALLPQLMSGKLRVKDAEKVLENAGV